MRREILKDRKGVRARDRANNTNAARSKGNAAGHDTYMGTMILALAARHRAERPAISMEGGT